jgi:hypothetical protein
MLDGLASRGFMLDLASIRWFKLCWPFQNYRGRELSKRSPSHE